MVYNTLVLYMRGSVRLHGRLIIFQARSNSWPRNSSERALSASSRLYRDFAIGSRLLLSKLLTQFWIEKPKISLGNFERSNQQVAKSAKGGRIERIALRRASVAQWQSGRFISDMSQVRILSLAPKSA